MEEREAVNALKSGDIGGLRALVEAHRDRAQRAAYLVVRDRASAEDAVQEAFVRAYEKIDTFDPARPFGPWFLKMVVNGAVRAASRREKVVPFLDNGEYLVARLADPEKGPHDRAEEAEVRRKVWAALGELPPAQRAAIVQRYYLGMSEKEMSWAAVASPGTIKSRLHAARKRLAKTLLSRSGADAPPADAVAGRGVSGRREGIG